MNRIYMDKEMEVVSLVRIVFNAWGKNEVEIKTAANKPITECQFMLLKHSPAPGAGVVFNFPLFSYGIVNLSFLLYFLSDTSR